VIKNSTEQPEQNIAQQNAELLIIGRKICTKCRIDKRLSFFGLWSQSIDGLRCECKLCRMSDSAKIKMLYIKPLAGIKECSLCKSHKEDNLINFFKGATRCKDCTLRRPNINPDKNSKIKVCSKCSIGKKRIKKYFAPQENKTDNLRPSCRDCDRDIANKWRLENRDRLKILARESYEINIESRKEAQKKWNDKNKGRVRKYKKERKLRVLMAVPKWVDSELINTVYEKAVLFNMEVDHIVPIKSDIVCGLHCWENLQLLIKSENRSKSNFHWPDMP